MRVLALAGRSLLGPTFFFVPSLKPSRRQQVLQPRALGPLCSAAVRKGNSSAPAPPASVGCTLPGRVQSKN